MLRNWKMLGLAVVTAVALSAAPVAAQPTSDGPAPDDKIATLQKQLEKQMEAINLSLKKAFEGVGLDIKGVKEDLKKVQDENLDLGTKLNLATGKIDALTKEVDSLRAKLATAGKVLNDGTDGIKEKIALYPPIEKAALDEIRAKLAELEKMFPKIEQRLQLYPPVPSVTVGRLVLVNAHTEDAMFNVNGRVYTVAAGMTQAVENIPSGPVTYEVFSPTYGLRARNTPMLGANETITLTVR